MVEKRMVGKLGKSTKIALNIAQASMCIVQTICANSYVRGMIKEKITGSNK